MDFVSPLPHVETLPQGCASVNNTKEGAKGVLMPFLSIQ